MPADPESSAQAPMRNSLRGLLAGTVRVEDRDLPVSDAWIDPEGMALRYVGLDLGGWLGRHVALVSARRLAWVDDGLVGSWRAEVTREEIEGDEARLEEGGGTIDIRALPPVLTGPFGYTISPMLIGAGLMAEAEEGAPPRAPADEEEGGEVAPRDRARALDRAGDWLDRPVAARHDVAGRAGEAGPRIADMLIDPGEMRLTHVVIDADGGARAVPAAHLGVRPEDGGPVPLALTRAEIAAMPDVVGPREAADRGLA